MKSSTGRWVSGDDFFNREEELRVLETHVRDHNHVLLTGQRRMGKTSIARELGRRLELEDWSCIFADVEAAGCAEDAIADIAKAAYPIRPITIRFAERMRHWVRENIEEISADEFRVKIRAGLDAGSWQRHGKELFRNCAEHDKQVLLVIDELPIFLKRMLQHDDGAQRVDEFLSWLRGAVQDLGDSSPVLIVSGSIGLNHLVRRLGIPDRINHLYSFRLGPWDRDTSIACFTRLSETCGLPAENGVANAVYEILGNGVPHHVQSFFARLRDFAIMRGKNCVNVEDVKEVYQSGLLGPWGQNDLVYYETRLKESLGGEEIWYSIVMEILAEAATQQVFTPNARRCLEESYSSLVDDTSLHVAEVLEILEHDGYLESGKDGHRFPSHLLRDWWAARFRHHVPIEKRPMDDKSGKGSE